MRSKLLSLLCLAAISLVSCVGDEGENQGKPEDDGKLAEGSADAWNYTNNPERFQLDFIYAYDELARYETGRAEQIPWPSDYWSYYEDSINVRFHGVDELSPVEKYDCAYNSWEPDMSLTPVNLTRDCGEDGTIENTHDEYYDHLGPAAKWQHQNKGNWRARNGIDDDGDGQIDECRRGDDNRLDYDGIETWWGLCHAWAPAAILEPEPLHSATVNGIEFTVSDIKALLIAQYDRNTSLMLGGRCNEQEMERDEEGRITRDECRDTNAGAFFVVITNMLGKDKRAFAEDRTAGYQVWNQPVLGYRILEERELSEAEALGELNKTPDEGSYTELFNSPEATSWRYVRMDVDYISESSNTTEGALTPNIRNWTRTDHYEMIIELNADGMVVGGEWINYSRETHPDFLWLPLRSRGGNPYMDTGLVRELLSSATGDGDEDEDTRIVTFDSETVIEIPDNNTTGIVGTIEVTEDIEIGSLKVAVDIEHTYIGDLMVSLQRGDQEITLHNRQGGGADNLSQTFNVDDFEGQSARGTWNLLVSDRAGQDVGALRKWSLIVSTNTPLPKLEFAAEGLPLDIPDNDSAGVESILTVNQEATIGRLEVTLNVTHTYIGDLLVRLQHGGSSQTLHAQEGGSADNIVKTFTVDSFNSAPLQGEWRLFISDNAGMDVGTLNSWSLVVTPR